METLVKTTETVLKFTDVEGMLKRMKAIKEFSELELEVWKRQMDAERKELTAKLEEERKKAVAGSEELDAAMLQLTDTETGLYDLATKTLPYIPKDEREEFPLCNLAGRRACSYSSATLRLPRLISQYPPLAAQFSLTWLASDQRPTIGAGRGYASVTQPPTPESQ